MPLSWLSLLLIVVSSHWKEKTKSKKYIDSYYLSAQQSSHIMREYYANIIKKIYLKRPQHNTSMLGSKLKVLSKEATFMYANIDISPTIS